jgi:DNA-binding NarL/FixJ family response regulator
MRQPADSSYMATGAKLTKVFLVEDALPIRKRLRVTVEESGARVVGEASTESDALRGIRATQPALVVLDLHLAEGNGVEVLRHIKQDGLETVVVIMTNHAHDRYRQSCVELGADYFLNKTADYSRFEQLMHTLIRVPGAVTTNKGSRT